MKTHTEEAFESLIAPFVHGHPQTPHRPQSAATLNIQRNMPLKTLLTPLALAALLLTGGCATTPIAGAQRPAYADFLSQPGRLRPVPNESGALVWIDPGADLTRYRRFLIEPIQVRLADDATYKTVDPTELKALADYLGAQVAADNAPGLVLKDRPKVPCARIHF